MRGSRPPKRGKGECSQQISRGFRCWHCGGKGHQRVECPTQGSPHCYICQAYSHFSRECPAKKAQGGWAGRTHTSPRPASEEKGTEEGRDEGVQYAPPPRMTLQAVAKEATTEVTEQALGPPSVPPTSPPLR
ncbi:protein lin-28 homolog A-like [Palaemon carinicauda]|uniref:protein lin-28 homolog A-like n=1 Tax=Palaemon carinicauda TaxID=392227 RepID=UPI0035B688A4